MGSRSNLLPLHGDLKKAPISEIRTFDKEQEKVKKYLSKFNGNISLSTDALRAVSMDQYLSVNIHFINDNWELKKWVIEYCCLDELDVKINPNNVIKNALEEYGIDEKLLTVTLSEFLEFKIFAKFLRCETRSKRRLPLNGQLFTVHCSSEIISMTMKKGFEGIQSIISKVKRIYWPESLPLWNLTSDKLSEAMVMEAEGLFRWLDPSCSGKVVPLKEDWDKVKGVCTIANRMYEIVKGLFEIENPTANLFLPYMREILVYLTEESENSDAFVSSVATNMLEYYKRFYNDMHLLYSIAAFLDPRYKLKLVNFCLSDTNRTTVILDHIRAIYNGYAVSGTSSENEEENGDKKPEKVDVEKKYCLSIRSTDDKPSKLDLDLYLEEPVFPWVKNFDVLQWWKYNCFKFPQLSKMAQDYLAIPLSVVSCDEAYLMEERKADNTLSTYSPLLLKAVQCLKSWNPDFKVVPDTKTWNPDTE
ncbi:zinc finger BED domain-containing protein RICESLEEPER 1-like [Amaranthus tricolor]|uniref:zinc finger BED domain-containing protein RICESLEEPER 1-like n=1 Tax=Amaranthus tricolor TaxID=29722 RepID=UPI002582B65F|nr:zinc finger BED domain-containing protein RICESLEEPER 1-like [Amaranthus tricolor]